MLSAKNLIGVVIIALSAILAAFILLNGKIFDIRQIEVGETGEAREGDGAALTSNSRRSENLQDDYKSTAAAQNQNDSNNLTMALAKQFARDILARNPEGPSDLEGEQTISVPSEIDIQKFVAENTANLDWQKFIPEIKDSSIKLTDRNSKADYENYFKKKQEALKEMTTNVSFSDPSSDLAALTKAADALTKSYESGIRKLYDVETPSNLKDLHKRQIALVTAQRSVFQKLAASASDPLGAILALESLKRLDQEFNLLTKDFSNFVSEKGLVLN